MSALHRGRVCTGETATQWSRLVADLERYGLLRGPGACDAVARVGADVLEQAKAQPATPSMPMPVPVHSQSTSL